MKTGPFDVHVFLGTGTAKRGNEGGCKAGERHSLLVFSRQPAGEALTLDLVDDDRQRGDHWDGQQRSWDTKKLVPSQDCQHDCDRVQINGLAHHPRHDQIVLELLNQHRRCERQQAMRRRNEQPNQDQW